MLRNPVDTPSVSSEGLNRIGVSLRHGFRLFEQAEARFLDRLTSLRSEAGALTFVCGIWLFCTWDLFNFVRTYGVNVPHYDEWENVPALLGEQPITWSWLWSQHNEHRIVIPRLVYLAVTKLAHNDFRAGMYFNVVVFSLEALALILVTHRVRGRTSYSDAFFPLALQTWGQAENLNCSFQVQFACSPALAVCFLVLCVSSTSLSTFGALGMGVCAVLLPLTGGNGLGMTPALIVAVILAGWGEWRRPVPRAHRNALGVWALCVLAVAVTACYFVDYKAPSSIPPSPASIRATVDALLQFLSMGFGQAVQSLWPESEPIVLGLLIVSFGVLGMVAARLPAQRDRALRLILVLGGLLSLALGIGWARAGFGPTALLTPRYATLAVPFWCVAYLAWETVERPRLRVFAQMTLFLCTAVLAVKNHDSGKQLAETHLQTRANFYRDIKTRVPLGVLVSRYYGFTYYAGPDTLKQRMRMLRKHRVGVFRRLKQ